MDTQFSNKERAEVLIEALPYIKQYYGKIIVIKYGGNAMINKDLKEQVMKDIVLLSLIGVKVVLVHGGGPEITDMLEKTGKKSSFVDGLRVTDKETVEIVQMVLAGKVNKSLVNLLGTYGGKAMGICGIDAHLIEATVKDSRLGYVGEITKVDITPINDLLSNNYIPVVSTVGCDSEGNVYNINADTAAAFIAAEINAERLISMTDIAGIMRDKDDINSLITEITIDEAEDLIKEGVVSGGMIPKVKCCVDAINRGVKKVIIMDGRVPHALLIEILTNEGAGTMVTGGNKIGYKE